MKHGFSLVELSIVLVILGLLTGGILAGQSLIRASELRSITTEYQRYATATGAFRDKYFALPGDMPNATSFWGATHGTLATCVVTASTGTSTCNGNGDGRISAGAIPVADNFYEVFSYWKQLANAGLIEGQYTGVQASATAHHSVLGSNVPASKISNAGWLINHAGTLTGTAPWYDGNYGNLLYVGASVANSFPHGGMLKPEEAWNIDTKMDDGRPGLGSVRVFTSSLSPNCTTTDVGSTAEYALTQTSKTCPLLLMLGM